MYKACLHIASSLHLIASKLKQFKTDVTGRETLRILLSMLEKLALFLVTSEEI